MKNVETTTFDANLFQVNGPCTRRPIDRDRSGCTFPLLRTLHRRSFQSRATRNSRSQTALTVVDRTIGLFGGALGLLFKRQ